MTSPHALHLVSNLGARQGSQLVPPAVARDSQKTRTDKDLWVGAPALQTKRFLESINTSLTFLTGEMHEATFLQS